MAFWCRLWQRSSSDTCPEASCSTIATPRGVASSPTTGMLCASTITSRPLRPRTIKRCDRLQPAAKRALAGHMLAHAQLAAFVAQVDQFRVEDALDGAGGVDARQPLGPAVPQHDLPVGIDEDHRIIHVVQQPLLKQLVAARPRQVARSSCSTAIAD